VVLEDPRDHELLSGMVKRLHCLAAGSDHVTIRCFLPAEMLLILALPSSAVIALPTPFLASHRLPSSARFCAIAVRRTLFLTALSRALDSRIFDADVCRWRAVRPSHELPSAILLCPLIPGSRCTNPPSSLNNLTPALSATILTHRSAGSLQRPAITDDSHRRALLSTRPEIVRNEQCTIGASGADRRVSMDLARGSAPHGQGC
jgi:hypothetical protein